MPLQGRVLQRIREIEEGYCGQGRPAAPRTVTLTGARQLRWAPPCTVTACMAFCTAALPRCTAGSTCWPARPSDAGRAGHSLGGALAVLAAYDIAKAFPSFQISCYTFGAPR